VRAALTASAAIIATLIAGLPAPALAKAPGSGSPTARQIRAAVRHAERSPALWATINICAANARQSGGELGVRGQMPSLGFASRLSMTVHLGSWSAQRKRFIPIPSATATRRLSLGPSASGLEQDGVRFEFTNPAGLLNATVGFTWTRAGKVLAQATRTTTAGHRDADFGQPAHYSAARCQLD
jgi:hypothetical protein